MIMTARAATEQEFISSHLIDAIVESVLHKIGQGEPSSNYLLKNQLFSNLLHGRIENEAAILQQTKALGIDLSPPRAVILIDATDHVLEKEIDAEQLKQIEQQRTQYIINSIVGFFHLPNDMICADLGAGKICVLKASNTRNLDPWAGSSDDVAGCADSSWANLTALKRAADELRLKLQQDTGSSIRIAIGRYHPGIKGLARSYEDARAALSLGSRLQKFDCVHCLAELGIAAFVGIADETTKVELAKYLLSPLDYEPDLLATINTFFTENCCFSATAKRLYIHRNTLNYRLEKIASLTGLDPRNFDDAVQIRISLLLRALNAAQH
jgi:carbohydrate diacid regulator